MKICIIGSGYVGLVTGTCFADMGNDVICVDNDARKVEQLQSGKVPIYEPGLEDLIKKNVSEKRLVFSTEIRAGVKDSKVVFICVQTPPRSDGSADLSYIEKVAREIAANMDGYKVIADKSTVPVETGLWVQNTIQKNIKKDISFDVASNPEFLREGSAIADFLKPDRVVIGAQSDKAREILGELYKPLEVPIIFTDIKSAEIIKHASNSFLAMKISFINAISNICEKSGADIECVAKGMSDDHRIGAHFLSAGIGYGGSCFPKDVAAFNWISGKLGYDFKLLREVERINSDQRKLFCEKISKALWVLKEKNIGVWGLSFKPHTDDLRNAPAIEIVRFLLDEGASVKAYDPVAMEKAKEIFANIKFALTPYDAAEGCDALVILTEWPEFKGLDLERIKLSMNQPLIIDGRNIYDLGIMEKYGFQYISIGRRQIG